MLSRDPLEPRLRRYLAERDAAPVPFGLEVRIMRTVEGQPTRLLGRSSWPRQLLVAAVIAALALGVAGAIAYVRHQSEPMPGGQRAGLTSTAQAELATLEARPLRIPAMPADGRCPVGPQRSVNPYADTSSTYILGPLLGSGPVYGLGGLETDTPNASYFDVHAYTDPTVHGIVLIRGQQLDGHQQIVWVGPYAAGPVIGSDTIDGRRVDLHTEAVLDTAHAPSVAGAAPGWGIWQLRDGVGRGASGCYGYQIDTAAGTEVFVAGGPAR